jgi:hypothetical protein
MIIEIIILLALLGSLAGFIYFVKHYFKTRRARNDNKRILLAIESSEDDNARIDKFYNNITGNSRLKNFYNDINWGKVITFIIVLTTTIIVIYNTFSSIENQATSLITPSPSINDSSNMTLEHFFPGLLIDSSGHLSFWALLGIGGIFFFIMWKFLIPRFDYSI